jgi:hypothetical protein
MKNTIKKGCFDYISQQRKATFIRSVILYLIPLTIFIVGYFYNGRDVKNFLTIVAVVGLLPAARSMVNTIMFFKAKGCTASARDRIMESGEHFHHYFDFYFTTNDKNYPVAHMMMIGKALIGLTETDKFDTKACEQHLSNHLRQDGIKDIAVKIYTDLDTYCERLAELHYQYDPLNGTDDTNDREDKVMAVMKAISL